MTKLEDLKAALAAALVAVDDAYADAYAAAEDARADAYTAAEDARAAAYAAYVAADDAWDAYEAELERVQKGKQND